MTRGEENAQLKAENAALREQMTALVERVRDLQARLAKDSHNSSKPPSTDGFKCQLPRTRSVRRTSGKQPGGQLGHPGETLHLVAEPDAVVDHWPAVCSACQASLDVGAMGATAAVVAREPRQVQDRRPSACASRNTRHPACAVWRASR
jgi:uncharacterized protein DUF6444